MKTSHYWVKQFAYDVLVSVYSFQSKVIAATGIVVVLHAGQLVLNDCQELLNSDHRLLNDGKSAGI